ncbi:hypothetical protein P3T42_007294 [Paraburkholderia sp. GAS38]|uniref:hypothetical protein n=1 Tax=Paraburkholderia sp. GAS38 TaxID=3035133 RepID=UPI003D1D44F0
MAQIGLNQPGFLYLNEQVLANVKSATGDLGKGTVDELKFGPLNDLVSELLFPWCSTLTSRARYYFFTYAVLQLALDRTIPREKQDPERDARECRELAGKYLKEFVRHVQRIEKYLTLALVLQNEQDGTFGQRRVNRWLHEGRSPVAAKSYVTILTADGRYPNAIYRAGSRVLGMFRQLSQNTALISARLRGEHAFRNDWMSTGARALDEARQVVAFWEKFEADPNTSLSTASSQFVKSTAARNFHGFELSSQEAEFLYRRIQAATPYWRKVTLSKLREIYKRSVSFDDLQAVFADVPEHEYLLAAGHIDNATKYWRHYYAEIVRDPERVPPLDTVREALPEIRMSLDWLKHTAHSAGHAARWEAVWCASYEALIGRWVHMVEKKDAQSLAWDLMARAERVVQERGRGKVAPHQRSSGDREDDIDVELDVKKTGFRFGNADRILDDIAKAPRHG